MTDDRPSDLSEALRWLRERVGISRDQLAAASGVSAVHIKFIERGKRNPSEAVIARLLPALRVTRADLDGLLRLRPWASFTASGEPATLSAYSAGVPLAVEEGSKFEAISPAAAMPPPASASPSSAPATPPPAATEPSVTAAAPAGYAPLAYSPSPPASPPPPGAAATPPAEPPPAATPPPPPPPSEPPTLDAELIELRERYVHLPRSKQELVLGWLRAVDDR